MVITLMITTSIIGLVGVEKFQESVKTRQVNTDLKMIYNAQTKWMQAHPGEPLPSTGFPVTDPTYTPKYNLTTYFALDNAMEGTKYATIGQTGPNRPNAWAPPNMLQGEYYSFWTRPPYAILQEKTIKMPGIENQLIPEINEDDYE